jgi:hypothetical protein
MKRPALQIFAALLLSSGWRGLCAGSEAEAFDLDWLPIGVNLGR